MDAIPARTVYTVTELNGSARLVLSSHFGTIWVEGEISSLAQPSSGHFYFTLKDQDAQVRCALFKGSSRSLTFRPANGMSVVARAQVGLYEPRGEYQLIVDYLEEAGDGALRRAYEALKNRLAHEGLFESNRKRAIPQPPRCLGVVTSPTGAAVRDILTVLKRRFPALPVIIFPVKVQGMEAKHEIVRAIALAERVGLCDTLILARGGGSMEDLWAFNEEIVARAIAACRIPIVCGIGHETDTTIADLVADLRAPTPSAAAEAVSPDGTAWLARLQRLEALLRHHLHSTLDRQGQNLAHLGKRLQQAHPEKQMQRNAQRLDELELRLKHSMLTNGLLRESRLQTLAAKLRSRHPTQTLGLLAARQTEASRRLRTAMARNMDWRRQAVQAVGEKLHSISPLATLNRGYAITSLARDGKIVRKAEEVELGETVEIRLAEGVLTGTVTHKR